jgi:hypothetical protein
LLVPGIGEDWLGSRMFGDGRRVPLLELREGCDGDCGIVGFWIWSTAVASESLAPCPTSIICCKGF